MIKAPNTAAGSKHPFCGCLRGMRLIAGAKVNIVTYSGCKVILSKHFYTCAHRSGIVIETLTRGGKGAAATGETGRGGHAAVQDVVMPKGTQIRLGFKAHNIHVFI